MAIKATFLGALISLAISLHLAAGGGFLLRRRRTAWGIFAAGFTVLLAAEVLRVVEVRRVPIQTMFEVFLFLGFLSFPLAIFSRRVLAVDAPAVDALLGALLLVPAGFVAKFSQHYQPLMPALQSPLFAPHVGAYMLAYVVLGKAAIFAIASLMGERIGRLEPDRAMDRLVRMGFPLLTVGLLLGCIWAKALGEWWNWDPKEMWSLASWLAFAAYLHARALWGKRHPRIQAAMVVIAVVLIVATLLWANLATTFQGYHTYAT